MSFSVQNSNKKRPIESDEHLIEALREAFRDSENQQRLIKFFINEKPKDHVSVLKKQQDIANDKVSWSNDQISEPH